MEKIETIPRAIDRKVDEAIATYEKNIEYQNKSDDPDYQLFINFCHDAAIEYFQTCYRNGEPYLADSLQDSFGLDEETRRMLTITRKELDYLYKEYGFYEIGRQETVNECKEILLTEQMNSTAYLLLNRSPRHKLGILGCIKDYDNPIDPFWKEAIRQQKECYSRKQTGVTEG